MTLAGFPANEPFHLDLQFPPASGVAGPETFESDGTWDSGRDAGYVGSTYAGVWTVTIDWSGGTLTRSLYIDCTQPDPATAAANVFYKCSTGGSLSGRLFKHQTTCDTARSLSDAAFTHNPEGTYRAHRYRCRSHVQQGKRHVHCVHHIRHTRRYRMSDFVGAVAH
jgi:hypothetical protein